ncbi:mas-related G-protein coupled receptor member H-like [Oenanthe melanoleuca]|uniref:mas-related G-protein coupled receptor member H-like n=1 Tax=Oenanthe melanoleuca TaxID=2939378 RepID=UPI0024C0FCB6|nr:mas-related G-protein coupled receptor member H-like [Oenanthe melanoleuca]XP_056348042.1 mas-related G-protein coupled receptor member H-like [Oenanthe melanoleuca]
MEVTTVSPSPASFTEGDNLCDRDVTSVAMHSVTLLICLCGLAGNGAVLWLLSLKIRNSGIFNLAFADFLFLVFTVPSILLFLVEDISCSIIMPLTYMSFLFQLSMVSFYWALFQLAFLNFRKDMTFLFELCCHCCHLPERLWWVVDSVQDWAFFALFTVIPMVTSLCPSHEQEQCRAALISMFTVILLLFVVPMVISRTIDIIRAMRGSKKQQPKRRDIIFLIVVFALLINLCNFLQQLGYMPVSSQVVFLLTCIHSSIKPFIYFLAGHCWSPCSIWSLRDSLQGVFE